MLSPKPYNLVRKQIKNITSLHYMLLGFFFSFGVPPYHYWLVSLIALSLLLRLVIVRQSTLKTFSAIFIFSLTHYSISSYWIINTFLVVIDNDFLGSLLGVLVLLVISASMALVTALTVTLATILGQRIKYFNSSLVLVPLFWALSEYIRSYFLGGQPMHYIGYMLGNNDYIIQLASIMNVQVVSFFFVFIAMLIARGGVYIVYSIVVMCLGFVFGFYQLENDSRSKFNNLIPLNVRLINANLTQSQLLASLNTYETVNQYIKLSKNKAQNNNPELIVWPESTLQFYIENGTKSYNHRKHITRFLTPEQSLITGGPRYRYDENGDVKYHGSIFHLNSIGNITGTYDKHILVPWGEYIPFRYLFPEELTNIFDVKDYTKGEGPLSINYRESFNILPLLCAEGHYPRLLADNLKEQSLIIMIGNEAWLEGTTEPSQYFVNARYRAVESGLPVLLASNKGYLAIIDSRGIVKKSIYSDKASVLDGTVLIERK